jgi:E3 ubiquitin-protein ligase RNF14
LDGCNKMTCIKCKSYFCWLCLTILSKTDPYSHFNAADSRCFNRLFEGIENRENDNNDNNFDDHDEDDDDDLGLLVRILFL